MEASKGNLALEAKARARALDKEDKARWDTEAMSSAGIMVVVADVVADGNSCGWLIKSS